jgi:uncharacterized repeat protein (TIGR03833 family)
VHDPSKPARKCWLFYFTCFVLIAKIKIRLSAEFMNGTIRSDVKKGLRVMIVLKKDQRTGTLTEGIVKDILTSAPKHHRGIKVRLEDGQIGRIQTIIG